MSELHGRVGLRCGDVVVDECATPARAAPETRIYDGRLVPDALDNDEPGRWCDAPAPVADGGSHALGSLTLPVSSTRAWVGMGGPWTRTYPRGPVWLELCLCPLCAARGRVLALQVPGSRVLGSVGRAWNVERVSLGSLLQVMRHVGETRKARTLTLSPAHSLGEGS